MSNKINWRRGITRLWILFSAIWIVFCTFILANEIGYAYRYYTDTANLKTELAIKACYLPWEEVKPLPEKGISDPKEESNRPPPWKGRSTEQQQRECMESYELPPEVFSIGVMLLFGPPILVGVMIVLVFLIGEWLLRGFKADD